MTTPKGPHLDPLTLARLLRQEGPGDADQLHLFISHLVRGCRHCVESLRQLTELEPLKQESDRWEEDRATDRQFDDALTASGIFSHNQQVVSKELQHLDLSLTTSDVADLEPTEAHPENRASCELLLERARRVWSEDPDLATSLLDLAFEISSGLQEEHYGASSIADLQARILAALGNVRRIVDDYQEANLWFEQALARLEDGSGDPLVQASIFSLLASLRRDQQRFREATHLLDDAIEAYRRAGNFHAAGRALIKQATVAQDLVEPARALEILNQARSMLDFKSEPRLELVVLHNTLFLMADTPEEAVDARTLLEQNHHLYDTFGDVVFASRLPWLEGKIALALGELDRAETFLLQARTTLLDNASPLIWALASLDFAIVLTHQRRFQEIEVLAQELLEAFMSRGLHQSTFATLLLLLQNAQAKKVTVEMLRSTALALRQAPKPRNTPAA